MAKTESGLGREIQKLTKEKLQCLKQLFDKNKQVLIHSILPNSLFYPFTNIGQLPRSITSNITRKG